MLVNVVMVDSDFMMDNTTYGNHQHLVPSLTEVN